MKRLTTSTQTAQHTTKHITGRIIEYITGGFVSSRILHRLAEIRAASRLTALLMLTTLLVPLVFFGGSPRVTANSASPIINSLPSVSLTAPLSAPPQAFAASSEPGFPAVLAAALSSSFVSASAKLANGYDTAANLIAPPAPPEGFSNAKMPTFGERVSASFSYLTKPES